MSKADKPGRVPSREQETSAQIARRMIGAFRSDQSGDSPARGAAAACNHLYRELSRWVGPDGCHALFTRALAEARLQHAPLTSIQLRVRSDPYMERVGEAIIAQGDPATTEALEGLLVRLIEILGRLIGDDMSMILIERSFAALPGGGHAAGGRREEA